MLHGNRVELLICDTINHRVKVRVVIQHFEWTYVENNYLQCLTWRVG